MKNEKGITLIEVLASLVLLSIVSLLTFNLLISAQNEHSNQTLANDQIKDISYAMKILTKDIRQSTSANNIDPVTNSEFHLFDYNNNLIAKYRYDDSTAQLYRNDSIVATQVERFEYIVINNSVSITIKNSGKKTFTTKLYFRKVG